MVKTHASMSREFFTRSFILIALGLLALASGCRRTGTGEGAGAARFRFYGTADSMPPFAVSAKPHTGSLSVHSFAREGADDAPAPSADGSWLVFASTRNSEEPQLYRQPSAGAVVTQLTYGPASHVQPAVSPDGREIAYAGNDTGSWDCWIMPAGGGSRENLTSTRQLDEVHPAWHPSGKVLAFTADRDPGKGTEWWVCAKSRGASGVSWIAPGLNPHWSPKGDRIVFQRAKERGRREYGIWTVEVSVDANGLVSGGAQSQIVADPASSAIEPAFSPDGERIAFAAVPFPEGAGPATGRSKRGGSKRGRKAAPPPMIGGDIWCVRVSGTDLVRLTATPEPEWNPAWAGTPAGRGENGRVFFVSERDGQRNIWSLLPALSAPGDVTVPPGDAREY